MQLQNIYCFDTKTYQSLHSLTIFHSRHMLIRHKFTAELTSVNAGTAKESEQSQVEWSGAISAKKNSLDFFLIIFMDTRVPNQLRYKPFLTNFIDTSSDYVKTSSSPARSCRSTEWSRRQSDTSVSTGEAIKGK